jgi:hypothetical protein
MNCIHGPVPGCAFGCESSLVALFRQVQEWASIRPWDWDELAHLMLLQSVLNSGGM